MSPENPLSVVVLAGGISHERDVSLRSGRRVADELTAAGHSVTLLDPGNGIIQKIVDAAPDVVWPALHGASGEDGALQALLEARGIHYVGSDPAAAALAWSKPTAKILAARDGINTPAWLAMPRETFRELGASDVIAEVSSAMTAPLVVKPAQGGSAQGVTIVTDDSDLPRALVDAYTYADTALIERKIEGVELAIGVLDTGEGAYALPAVEIEPVSGVYSFEARYNAGETTFYAPARVSAEIAEKASEVALRIHSLLGLRHFSRIDLIVDAAGDVFFLEANMIPGTTETSLFPLAIDASGRTLADTYSELAIFASGRHSQSA